MGQTPAPFDSYLWLDEMGNIVSLADIFPGATVVEGGLGSGSLTAALLRGAGYEFREGRAPGAPQLAEGAAQQRIALVPLGMGSRA